MARAKRSCARRHQHILSYGWKRNDLDISTKVCDDAVRIAYNPLETERRSIEVGVSRMDS